MLRQDLRQWISMRALGSKITSCSEEPPPGKLEPWGYAESGRFRASAGTGIKEPTFFENYATGFTIGNPDLAPERSSSWEVGWEQGLLDGALCIFLGCGLIRISKI